MPYYTAYFDASGNYDLSHRFMTVAGLVAPNRKWDRFKSEWQGALAAFGISVFHMTDFVSSKREFKGWQGKTDRRVKLISSLSEIVRANAAVVVATSVDLKAWDDVNERYPLSDAYGHPYALCGIAAVGQVRQWSRRKELSHPIELIFEAGDTGAGDLQKRLEADSLKPNFRSKLDAIPCQAADLVAWKHRVGLTNRQHATDDDEMQDILRSIRNIRVQRSKYGQFEREALIALCKGMAKAEKDTQE